MTCFDDIPKVLSLHFKILSCFNLKTCYFKIWSHYFELSHYYLAISRCYFDLLIISSCVGILNSHFHISHYFDLKLISRYYVAVSCYLIIILFQGMLLWLNSLFRALLSVLWIISLFCIKTCDFKIWCRYLVLSHYLNILYRYFDLTYFKILPWFFSLLSHYFNISHYVDLMITCYVSYFEFSLSSHIILLIWLNNWLIHNVILSNFLIILTYFEIHHYFKVLSLYLNILSCFNFKNMLFQYNMSLCQVTISLLSRYFFSFLVISSYPVILTLHS